MGDYHKNEVEQEGVSRSAVQDSAENTYFVTETCVSNDFLADVRAKKDKKHEQMLINEAKQKKQELIAQEEALIQKKENEKNKEINTLLKGLKPLLQRRFVKMKNKKVWFDRNLLSLYPTPDAFGDVIPIIGKDDVETARRFNRRIEGFTFRTPYVEEVQTTFATQEAKEQNPFWQNGILTFYPRSATARALYKRLYKQHKDVKPSWLVCCNAKGQIQVLQTETARAWLTDVFNLKTRGWFTNSENGILIPIHRLRHVSETVSAYDVLIAWMDNGLHPWGLSTKEDEQYDQLMAMWKQVKTYIQPNSIGEPYYNKRSASQEADYAKLEELKAKPIEAFMSKLPADNGDKAEDKELSCDTSADEVSKAEEELLNCDFIRANISPYPAKRLSDINLGHWELCEPPASGFTAVQLPKGTRWVARPPQLDVRQGVCAIDFGTKSTVVVCRDEHQDERLLRIGKGNFDEAPTETDYENPTAVELIHFDDFMKAYRARNGRPFTRWQDMTVSHQAAESIFVTDAAADRPAYYSVFNEMKQWANDPDRRMHLTDKDGKIVELKPYSQLAEGNFDPIELYAYYLGLYINNMTNGIYLDYILSFPVNFSTKVREHIRQSFERGLRKSLPPTLQADERQMKHFRVQNGISEPAAYAITALEAFGIEPKDENDRVAYGVFDFGGGTTDFDFGIASIPANGRYNMQIEQFGYGGDPYLGGENILSLMAYEVFQENVKVMRENHICMVLPYGARRFSGSEVLVEDRNGASQEAYLNTRILQKALRPIWERTEGFDKLFNDDQQILLYSTEKGGKKPVALRFDENKLGKVIHDRIAVGVQSFFAKLEESLNGLRYTSKIHIFLAGNSSKSPVVQELFKESVKQAEKALHEQEDQQGLMELHMPLGMDASASGAQVSELDRVRTGKTGVAFGLLRARKGARDVKVINRNDDKDKGEVKFPYYIGMIRRDKTFKVTIGPEVEYGQWAEYLDASEDEFELRYTKAARAQTGTVKDAEVDMVRCYLDEDEVSDEEDVNVYLCKKDTETVQYTVGRKDEKGNFQLIGKIHEVKLK